MRKILWIISSFILLVACDPTPDYVLKKEQMQSLLVDIHKGETYAEINSGKFFSDSTKKALRQSIFLRHNVTQEQFDTSLVWYAHHIKEYTEMYEEIIARLENEDKQIREEAHRLGKVTLAQGDSVNLWDNSSIIAITPSHKDVLFDIKSDGDFHKGDRFEWTFRLFNNNEAIAIFFGIDYSDGSTSYISRMERTEGRKHVALQSDSSRSVSRVYGSILMPQIKQGERTLFDSVQLVRTRINRERYSNFNYQRLLIGNGDKEKTNSGVSKK